MAIARDARAWYLAFLANEFEPFDPVAHRRRDIGLKTVSFREEETVEAHVCNVVTAIMPTAQLVGKVWAILSFVHPDGTLHPICRMKRRPVPSTETQGELALEFEVLPGNWQDLRDAGLAELKVRPFFDELLVALNRRNDPTEILDGHRRIGHFHRVTGEYSTPELLGVGLPVKVLGKKDLVGWKDGGGVRVRRTKAPLAGVQVYLTAAWQQTDDGYVDLTAALKQAFPNGAVGDPGFEGPSASKTVPGGVIATLTPDALESSLPEKGAGIGGSSGYTVLERTLRRIPTPPGAPPLTGAVRGQKARYNFTSDKDLKNPINLGHEIFYYDGSLVLNYALRQRREERVGFFMPNANVAFEDGVVETLTLKVEDPTVDATSQPYLSGQAVVVGDERRVGIYVWAATRAHLTRGSFADDLYAANGAQQWELLGSNNSPAGTSNLSTFVTTQRGVETVVAAAHKGHKKLSLSQRAIEVRFAVLLEDWLDITSAWAVRLEGIDDPLVPSGTAIGKVTAYELGQSGLNEAPKILVTIAGCDGGGIPGPGPDAGINPTGESWDGVTLTSPLGAAFPPAPIPNGTVIVENHPEQQVTYVQARDFTGAPGRDDRTLNDPKHLLSEAKTKPTIACEQISGQPTLTLDLTLYVSPWSGPAQIVYPTV